MRGIFLALLGSAGCSLKCVKLGSCSYVKAIYLFLIYEKGEKPGWKRTRRQSNERSEVGIVI